MNRFVPVALSILFAVLILTGCGHKKGEEEALKAVLYNNLKAFQEENVEACLATMHPESPSYGQMEALLPQVFKIYDLDHKLIEVKVLDVSGDTARVRTVQEARRLSGPENYRNVRTTDIHILKKYKGEWRLYEQEHQSMEYID